jgi:hypothetical protein
MHGISWLLWYLLRPFYPALPRYFRYRMDFQFKNAGCPIPSGHCNEVEEQVSLGGTGF